MGPLAVAVLVLCAVAVTVALVGVVIRRLDDITTGIARLVALVSGISRVGQVVGLAGGLRRGLGVFVSRLKSRER
jgi:uncharacterized membrane protein YhaH (DUF805 family)